MKITYKGLIIDFPYTLSSIEEVGMESCFCEHPIFHLTAVIPEEGAESYISSITSNTTIKVNISKEEGKGEAPFFYGFVDSVNVAVQGGLYILNLRATAYSAKLDVEKKSRSFFKKGITYREIFRAVIKDYPGADMIENIETSRVADFPIIQYQETDWEFIKRLASLFEAVVTPDCTGTTPRFTLGRPASEKMMEAEPRELSTARDLKACMKDYYQSFTSISIPKMKKEEEAQKNGNQGFLVSGEEKSTMNELFFTTFSFLGGRYFPVGTLVKLNNIRLMVTHVEAFVEKGDLYYQYIVRWPEAIVARYEDNKALQGVSLVGTVKKCVGNTVSLNLEIDEDDGYDNGKEDHFFTYAIESKAYYCMPVAGAKIHLYFPTGREWEAIAVNSLRSAGAGAKRAGKTENPQNKSLSNDSGVSVDLTPSAITLTPHDDNQIKISLGKDGTVKVAGKNITMTGEDINFGKALGAPLSKDAKEIICKSLSMTASDTLFLTRYQGGGALTDIVPIDDHFTAIKGVTQLYATASIHHDTTGPGKAPAVSYDDAELVAQEEAAAKEQNDGITNTLIQRKKEARAAFGKGLLMLAAGAALAVATFATGGAALAIVAGVGMAAFGAAEMHEGMSGKALAESGDWSTPANNFIKDVIPDPYYTVLKNGFCIAGSILFAGPGVLIGGAINTAFTLGFDLIPDGRIDSDWKDLLNDFGTACMITSLTGPIGKLGNCESIAAKTGMRFLQQMASGTLYDLASGDLSLKNFAQNLVQESISSLVSGRIGNKFWSAATDIALDTGLDAGMQVWDILYNKGDLKKDFDYQRLGQTFVRSLIMNGKYSCDPVDCARGNLFYYKKDITSDDLYGEFLFSRRYDSVLTYEGAFGTGWVHTYETFLTAHDTYKISAVLPDTHMETFYLKDKVWENEKGGSKLFTLTHDALNDSFSLVSREGGNYRKYVYNSNGRLKEMYDSEGAIPYRISYALEEWLLEEAEAKERGEEGLRKRRPDYFELSRITSPGGRTLTFAYENGRIVSLTDQGKRKVRYEYTDNRLVKVHYPSIGIQEYGYDDKGHLVEVKGEDGRDFIRNTFDITGRVIKQSYPDGNDCTIAFEDEKRQTVFTFSDTGRTERYTYDREKRIIRMEYGDGVEERYAYDVYGNRTMEMDKNGNTTYRTYNVFGQVTEEKQPDGLITSYFYNEKNKLEKLTDNQGTRIEYTYDAGLNPVTEKEYLTEQTYLTTNKTYDSRGRLLRKTNDLGHTETYVYGDRSIYHPTKWITAEGEEFTYTYDHAGRRKSVTSAYGTVEFGYSETGEINRITDALGNTTRKNFGATGNVVKIVPPNAYREYEQEQGFTYRYDYLDRLVESRDPYGSVHALKRDMDGNIRKDIHPNGYDRITHDGPGMEYVYDKRQYKVKEITPAGGIRRYVTDKQGNIRKVIQPEAYEKAIEQAKELVHGEIDGRERERSREREYFSGKNREERVEERATEIGEGISYAYDSRNRLQEVIDTDGTVLRRLLYDKKGRLVKDIPAEGYAYADTDEERYGTLYRYNQAGWLLEKREPVERLEPAELTAYESEASAKKNDPSVVGEKGKESFSSTGTTQTTELKKGSILYNLTVYEYDLVGNCVEEKHSAEKVSESGYPAVYHSIYQEYDKRNRLVRVSDSLGAAMEYAYDSLNNRTMEKARINEDTYKLTLFLYDKAGRLSQVKAAVDFKDTVEKDNPYMEKAFCITKFGYDKNGNVTEILTPEGYVIKREYDLVDRVVKEEHMDKANGIHRVLTYAYDKAGNLIRQTKGAGGTNGGEEAEEAKEYLYDYENNVIKQTDEEGNVTRYFYDKNNSLIKAVSPDNYREELDDGKGTTFTYDAFGRMESVRNALGYLEESNQYNKAGQLIRKGDESGTLVEYQYDIGGRIQSIATGEMIQERGERDHVSQSFTYDARGNITGIRDGEGNRTLYKLDAWGRMESLHKPDGSEEHYTYDYAGNITTTTDGKGGILTYRYNSFNQLGEILDQTGEKEQFFYDKQGRLTKQTDRNQNSIVYKLNIDDQLVYKKEEKSGMLYAYKYNTKGQLTEAIGGGVEYQYEYTKTGSVKTKHVNHKLALQYSYTKSGNVAGILDATGKKTEYAYDEANRVKKVMDNGSLLVTYGYHADNTLAQARFTNGITTEYTYDKDKNPASITTTTRTGEKLFAYRYAYDYNGNRIVKQDARELTSGDLQRVGDYGRIGETGGQAGEQPKLPQTTRYRYDPLQRIAGVSYADGREESLAYDSAGNRALRKYGTIEEAYQYDNRNRLTEVLRKDNERAENNRITSYQYDNQGNTLQEETRGYTESLLQNSRYEYDGFNKTRKVTVEYFGNETDLPTATQTQENFYDAENLRYGITENGARTNFITNGWKVLSEQDESNQTTNRIVLGYGIIASDSLKQEGDGYQYFHWNEHGDTEYITGEDGQVRNSYGYDAFGSLTMAEEIVRNRYTYNGEQYDAITSQYYLRARFYNPQVARFTQEDVYRGDGLNLYAYCANNPVMYEDPSGYDRAPSVVRAYYATGDTIAAINDVKNGGVGGNKEYGYAILKGGNNYDNAANKILSKNNVDGIWYKGSRPDFTPVAMFNVNVKNMSDKRQGKRGNYELTRKAIAYEIISTDGNINVLMSKGVVPDYASAQTKKTAFSFLKSDEVRTILDSNMTTRQKVNEINESLKHFQESNKYTVHEVDSKTAQLVPTEVNARFNHDGGVSDHKNKKKSKCPVG